MATNARVKDGIVDVKPITNNTYLDAVKVLHETVVGLRKALERSQSELHLLKTKVVNEDITSKYNNTIEQLSLENHVLRGRILHTRKLNYSMDNTSKSVCRKDDVESESENENTEQDESKNDDVFEASEPKGNETFSFHKSKEDSEESSEVDDIELIFTTDDTKVIGPQEELESISDDGGDEYDPKSELNESEKGYLQPTVLTQSVLVETDISKCGIVSESDSNNDVFLSPNRPTLNPVIQRYMLHAEQKTMSLAGQGLKYNAGNQAQTQTTITRPILHENNSTKVRDSETQTDISAVPPHWKSESFLAASKGNQNFPTLPSKFAIPFKPHGHRKSLKLTDKTQEARRILLSDINFTSMVPELSRSVDHLCQNGLRVSNAPSNVIQSPLNAATMKFLRSPALLSSSSSFSSRFEFSVANSKWKSSEGAYIPDQDRSTQDLLVKRRQSRRPSMFSLDTYYANRTSSVPPSPTIRRHSAAIAPMSTPDYSPESQFFYGVDRFNFKTASNMTLKNASSSSVNQKLKPKVSFRESLFSKNTGSRQSLPNMYVDIESGEESTDSLIDESEECVRKVIDTTLNLIDWPYIGYRYVGRTYSVPNLFLEFSPPLSARPFIARSANDLKVNYFIKVINKDGRVVGGRIQFVGQVPGKTEPYVGIMLPPNMGESDGTWQGFRYFTCERNCGLFVPFRKVVMAWKV